MSSKLQVPSLIVSRGDVARLTRELEALEDYVHQSSLRGGGTASTKLPRTSRGLDELMNLNKLNFLQATDRTEAKQYLTALHKAAPVLHMSFAADPSAAFVAKLIVWLRSNIHPSVLLNIGLQPTIVAGCVLRTPNHQFDFSLRKHFEENRGLLIERLEATKAP